MQFASNKNDHAQPPTFDRSPEDRMQFVRLNIRDWLQGTRNLEPSQAGVYIQIVLLFSDNLGVLPDDDGFVAGHLKMGVRYYRNIKAQLIALGKIEIRNGYIWNRRAAVEVASFCSTSKAKRKAAREREEKKRNERASGASQAPNRYPIGTSQVPDACTTGNENSKSANDNNDGVTTALPLPSTEKEKEKELPPHPLKGACGAKAEKLQIAKHCFDDFRVLAQRLPRAEVPRESSFSDRRAKKILAVLLDQAGRSASDSEMLEVWREALSKAERSAFLRGETSARFKLTIGFLCQPDSFAKLIDGGFDGGFAASSLGKGAPSSAASEIEKVMGRSWQ